MSHNLQYQFLSAINAAFREGYDKHSIKKECNEKITGKVYSYASRKELIETSAMIARYMTINYGVIYIRDISKDMMEQFIVSKVGLSVLSINQYVSRIRKLQELVNNHFYCDVDWKLSFYMRYDKVRDIWFEREDYDLIMDFFKHSKADSYKAIDLAGRFALRVSECCALRAKDLHIKDRILHIHASKGGRDRDIPILDEDVERCYEYIKGVHPEKKIVSVYEDSVNRYLHRACERLGLKQYSECKTGVHAIRKKRAQEIYDIHRNVGNSRDETINYVNQYLGHGKDRNDITRAYIKNAW